MSRPGVHALLDAWTHEEHMAYDEALAARIRLHLQGSPALTERKMFGGIGWMIRGNMAAGAGSGGALIVRCTADFEALIAKQGVKGMEKGGRVMQGWIEVDAAQLKTDEALHAWLDRGREHAESLPEK